MRSLLIGALLLAVPAGGAAQPVRGIEAAADVDAAVQTAIAAGQLPGAVVVIGRSDAVLFRQAYGQRRLLPAPEPMALDTVFDLASLSKAVATTTVTMILVERGTISLDDPVSRWIPEFSGGGKERVTLRQLLTHTSGLPPVNPLRDYADGPEAGLRAVLALRLATPPGRRVVYSDLGFIVLGEALRRATGRDLATLARELVFAPLGMRETTYQPQGALRTRAAPTEQRMRPDGTREEEYIQGVVHDPRAFRLGGVAGNAGVFSTAADLTRFAQAMLGRGALGEARLMREETFATMLTPQRLPGGARRGIGWVLADRGSPFSSHAFGHVGWTGTSLWIDPERDLFVLLLSNRVHPTGEGDAGATARRIQQVAAAAIDRGEGARVHAGIDVLRRGGFETLRGARVGLITNQAAVARDGRTTAEVLRTAPGMHLVALFSPEHGLGANRHGRVANTRDPATGLPVYSLFGPTRRPTREMLAGVDTIVFDVPDVGTRFYTYVSTMRAAMESAAELDLRFVVLDRPNPIDGVTVEGPLLDDAVRSFVNHHPLPVRHGMTAGELARLFAAERNLRVRLEVVRIEGWRRNQRFSETGMRWVPPSPNLRTARQALLYPAVGLLEGTNVSVGRGTPTPFELVAAPWIDGRTLAARLEAAGLPGVRFSATEVTPRSGPYRGERCGGVRIEVRDPRAFRAVDTGLAVAIALRALHRDEWETTELIRLVGSQRVVDAIVAGQSLDRIRPLWRDELAAFERRRAAHLLY